jgi:hypothetical protein
MQDLTTTSNIPRAILAQSSTDSYLRLISKEKSTLKKPRKSCQVTLSHEADLKVTREAQIQLVHPIERGQLFRVRERNKLCVPLLTRSLYSATSPCYSSYTCCYLLLYANLVPASLPQRYMPAECVLVMLHDICPGSRADQHAPKRPEQRLPYL